MATSKKKSIQLDLPFINHFIAFVRPKDTFSDSVGEVKKIVKSITDNLGLTAVKEDYHSFSPMGLTFIAILAQSHLIVHIWPEYKFLHIDLMSCKQINIKDLQLVLEKIFPNNEILKVRALEI